MLFWKASAEHTVRPVMPETTAMYFRLRGSLSKMKPPMGARMPHAVSAPPIRPAIAGSQPRPPAVGSSCSQVFRYWLKA